MPHLKKDIINNLYTKMSIDDDEEAFEAIFEMLHSPLYHWAFSFVKSKENSEDIVIESFSKLWEGRKKYVISNLTSFMYTLVKNQSLDIINSLRNRTKHISFDDIEFSLQRYQYSPEHKYIEQEDVDIINIVIDSLPAKEKAALYMAREQKLTYKEIAEIMGVSTRSVERYINKSITTISEKLGIKNPKKSKKHISLMSFILM